MGKRSTDYILGNGHWVWAVRARNSGTCGASRGENLPDRTIPPQHSGPNAVLPAFTWTARWTAGWEQIEQQNLRDALWWHASNMTQPLSHSGSCCSHATRAHPEDSVVRSAPIPPSTWRSTHTITHTYAHHYTHIRPPLHTHTPTITHRYAHHYTHIRPPLHAHTPTITHTYAHPLSLFSHTLTWSGQLYSLSFTPELLLLHSPKSEDLATSRLLLTLALWIVWYPFDSSQLFPPIACISHPSLMQTVFTLPSYLTLRFFSHSHWCSLYRLVL